ncbi:hypothetical protein [Candidatus Poriferisodalis sp.]|uniref:hypothetical protein n=1 Tax=Candidatus Poriferisodalis sp. TaxID=3101277 RepID=UPI003B5A4694
MEDELMNDDGGELQRRQLRAAGVLVAADARLRPTTTMVADDESGATVAVATLLLDVTRPDCIDRVVSWMRDTATLLETLRELER